MWDFVSWSGCVSNTRVWLHFQTPRNSEKSSVSFCVCFISYNSDYLVHLLLSFITGITTKPEHELTFDTANSSLIPHNEFYKRRCFASTKIDVRFWTDKKYNELTFFSQRCYVGDMKCDPYSFFSVDHLKLL